MLQNFSAAKAALEMQMSVRQSVLLSVIKPIGKVPMGKLDTPTTFMTLINSLHGLQNALLRLKVMNRN